MIPFHHSTELPPQAHLHDFSPVDSTRPAATFLDLDLARSRESGLLAPLATRLLASPDPRDQIGAKLLPILETKKRLTLHDAIAKASSYGRSEEDALIAIERRARPNAAGLRRFYIDRAGQEPRILEPEEVRQKMVELHDKKKERKAWASSIEVVWATSPDAALGLEGAS